MGNIFMALRNLGEQCYLNHYGPVDVMDMMTMMDMIKVSQDRCSLKLILHVTHHHEPSSSSLNTFKGIHHGESRPGEKSHETHRHQSSNTSKKNF